MDRPFSPSSERNREPILHVLREVFAPCQRVLEIGSGTGQHAAWFAQALPHLVWQSSDRAENLPGIRAWAEQGPENLPAPLRFDVNQNEWPRGPYDAIFSANTLHIMAWEEVGTLFRRLPELLAEPACVAIYGPFKYAGAHTSPSNAAFDQRLKSDDPRRGIRDVEAVNLLAEEAGLILADDRAMPANNRCLIWRQGSSER